MTTAASSNLIATARSGRLQSTGALKAQERQHKNWCIQPQYDHFRTPNRQVTWWGHEWGGFTSVGCMIASICERGVDEWGIWRGVVDWRWVAEHIEARFALCWSFSISTTRSSDSATASNQKRLDQRSVNLGEDLGSPSIERKIVSFYLFFLGVKCSRRLVLLFFHSYIILPVWIVRVCKCCSVLISKCFFY